MGEPLGDGAGGEDPKVRGKLVLERRGLDGNVGLDGPAVVGSVEGVELVRDEGEGGIDGQFHDGHCCSFNQFNLGDALMG